MVMDAGSAVGTGEAQGLFSQTMGLVAATIGLFALGAYLGRDLSVGWGWAFFIGAFACLVAMRFAVRQAASGAVGLLFGFGLLMGLAMAPTIAYYAGTDPRAVWDAAAATALFMAGLGAVGYGTRSDLSGLARLSSWALVGLIAFGIVMIFADIPDGALVYSVAGLVIFAGLTLADFQRLRTSDDSASAPFLAASIFLDGLNVFLFFLNIFERNN
ncbi:MAG TPA: Bax inhibitor-1 family protein [Acidimicrobiales bacterium]|nr:Bax inhibitor-1 family protein [Acidimicrobiales bacterium]